MCWNEKFWDQTEAMYVDQWDRSFTTLSQYRGINANMHAVEALLAATDATGDTRWRQRALGIAQRVTEFARGQQWRIPEHFDPAWRPLFDHNRDRPDDPFQPFGATVGHGMEWSRLMLHLDAGLGEAAPEWLTEAAAELFDRAVTDGWAVDGAPGSSTPPTGPANPLSGNACTGSSPKPSRPRPPCTSAPVTTATSIRPRNGGTTPGATSSTGERGSWHHELDPQNRPAATVWQGKPDLYHAVQATLIPRLPLTPGLALALRTQQPA